jgi:hypothetical protein
MDEQSASRVQRGLIVSISFLQGFLRTSTQGFWITQSTLLQCGTLTLLHNVREDWCEGDEKDGKSVTSCK